MPATTPPRHKTPLLNEHSVLRRHSFTHTENTHTHTHTLTDTHQAMTLTGAHAGVHVCTHTHIETRTPTLMLPLLLFCLSSLTFHNVFYIKIKEGSRKSLKKEVKEESDL